MVELLMERALQLAKKGLGLTAPNPAVGAVIVRDGYIIGEGWHRKAGGPHAEVEAMVDAGGDVAGAEIYVTLEPCAHEGRTGSCAKALVQAGISKVYVGMLDPFEKVNGEGLKILRDGGVEVEVLGEEDLARRIRAINQPFLKMVNSGLPYVVMKAGMSLDGKIATAGGESKWITGERAREDARSERARCDAVLVGAGTVRADDPHLGDGLRVIVSSQADLDPGLQVFRDEKVLYACGKVSDEDRARYQNVEMVENFGTDAVGIRKFWQFLAERGVQSIYVEGGSTAHGYLYSAFLEDRDLIDRALFYIAPKIIGGKEAVGAVGGVGAKVLADVPSLEGVSFEPVGKDFKMSGYFNFY